MYLIDMTDDFETLEAMNVFKAKIERVIEENNIKKELFSSVIQDLNETIDDLSQDLFARGVCPFCGEPIIPGERYYHDDGYEQLHPSCSCGKVWEHTNRWDDTM